MSSIGGYLAEEVGQISRLVLSIDTSIDKINTQKKGSISHLIKF